jgi:hypothetical protein
MTILAIYAHLTLIRHTANKASMIRTSRLAAILVALFKVDKTQLTAS